MTGFKLELGFVTDGDGMAMPDEAYITFNDGDGSIKVDGVGAHDLAPILAAGPDLLTALKAILANDGGTGSEQFHAFKHYDARQAGFAAIAKAEGRS